MSIDARLAQLSPHKRKLTQPALLTPDAVSKIIGMPVWQVANLVPIKIGARVYRYRAVELDLEVTPAKDSTIPQVARRWGVSDGLIRRMVKAKRLKLRSMVKKPALVTAASIRRHEKAR